MIDLDLSEAGLKHAGFGGVPEVCGNEGDVGDCYYNFALPELASWFGNRHAHDPAGACEARVQEHHLLQR